MDPPPIFHPHAAVTSSNTSIASSTTVPILGNNITARPATTTGGPQRTVRKARSEGKLTDRDVSREGAADGQQYGPQGKSASTFSQRQPPRYPCWWRKNRRCCHPHHLRSPTCHFRFLTSLRWSRNDELVGNRYSPFVLGRSGSVPFVLPITSARSSQCYAVHPYMTDAAFVYFLSPIFYLPFAVVR